MNCGRSALLVVLSLAVTQRAAGQGIAAEALGAAQLWKTDQGSVLLARDSGSAVMQGEFYGWLAWQPVRSLQLTAIGYADVESGVQHDDEAELQLLSARWWHSRQLRVDAGKILLPLGEFAPRRFANVNPLIGEPDTYVSEYPWGISVSGAAGRLDYVAAVVSLPAVNQRYTPAPDNRFRPVIGAGVSFGPGLRVGGAITHGPYLGHDDTPFLAPGTSWYGFNQTVATLDVHYSVGHWDTHGEAAWSRYDVPTLGAPVDGLGWYVDTRLTLSPRWFAAARFEHNRYAFVLPLQQDVWIGTATTQMNGEIGAGYRLSASTLCKASLRRDHWPVHQVGTTTFPDGYAIAAQMSVDADLVELLTRKP